MLSSPVMGKSTIIRAQGLQLMCSQAVKMSELVSFIDTLVKECQQLSQEVEKKMSYASKFQEAIKKHHDQCHGGQSSKICIKQEE